MVSIVFKKIDKEKEKGDNKLKNAGRTRKKALKIIVFKKIGGAAEGNWEETAYAEQVHGLCGFLLI